MPARSLRPHLRALSLLIALFVAASALLISPANALLQTIYNTSRPKVEMSQGATAPAIGALVHATEGTWAPVKHPVIRYQWLADDVDIAKATEAYFKVTPDLLGKRLSVRVTASGFLDTPASATSDRTAPVELPTIRNLALPVVKGTLKVDHTLDVSTGIWSPSGTHSYQWFADGAAIEGATAKTFTLTPAQAGKKMSIRVTLSAEGYLPGSATSQQTAPVEPGTITNLEPPTVTGTPTVDHTLDASTGSWSMGGTHSYQWFADGAAIEGATAKTFTLTPAQAGKKMSVRVTLSQEGYLPASADSVPTAPVEPGTITNLEAPTLLGTFKVGNTVGVDPGSWSRGPLEWTYRWFADGQLIAGATAATLVLDPGLAGKKVKAEVTGSKPGYTPAVASSEPSAVVTCSAVPPASIRKGGVTTSRIRVGWSKAFCASTYVVRYRLTTATTTKTVVVGDVSTYVLTGLAKGRSYRISVASIGPDGIQSKTSPSIVVKTKR